MVAADLRVLIGGEYLALIFFKLLLELIIKPLATAFVLARLWNGMDRLILPPYFLWPLNHRMLHKDKVIICPCLYSPQLTQAQPFLKLILESRQCWLNVVMHLHCKTSKHWVRGLANTVRLIGCSWVMSTKNSSKNYITVPRTQHAPVLSQKNPHIIKPGVNSFVLANISVSPDFVLR